MMLKECSLCKVEKNISNFYSGKKYKHGVRKQCKQCLLNLKKENYIKLGKPKNLYQKKYQKERAYFNKIKCLYNITFDEYTNLLNKQNGVCSICNNQCISKKRLAIDHCHKSGKIRGLLCSNCNTALGLLKESIFNLESMIKYIKNNKEI